jgi:hypothetical protein
VSLAPSLKDGYRIEVAFSSHLVRPCLIRMFNRVGRESMESLVNGPVAAAEVEEAMWCGSAVKQLGPSPTNDPIHATRQYSSGKSRVVADRSASVIIQIFSPASVL